MTRVASAGKGQHLRKLKKKKTVWMESRHTHIFTHTSIMFVGCGFCCCAKKKQIAVVPMHCFGAVWDGISLRRNRVKNHLIPLNGSTLIDGNPFVSILFFLVFWRSKIVENPLRLFVRLGPASCRIFLCVCFTWPYGNAWLAWHLCNGFSFLHISYTRHLILNYKFLTPRLRRYSFCI